MPLVLLRLALQVVKLRHLKAASSDEQQRAALETREIFAPLANRLGIWHVKWELEDLAFRYSQPADYKRIAGWLRSKRTGSAGAGVIWERFPKFGLGFLLDCRST